MNFRFDLAIYKQNEGLKCVPIKDYIQQYTTKQISWRPDLDDSTILFEFGDALYIADVWNLGRADYLAPQFEAVIDRLRNHQPALLRSAVIEGSELPYLVFEPLADNEVSISLFVIPDAAIECIFPAGPFAEKSNELYNYFIQHRDQLLAPTDPSYKEYFRDLRVPADKLLKSLEAAAREARELFNLPGMNLPD